MSLADPQTITVNAVAKVMPRVLVGNLSSTFELSDKTFSLAIRHSSQQVAKKARVKSLASFTQRKIVPDPLTAVNDYETVTISIQVDRPEVGFTTAEIDQMSAGFKTWLSTALLTQLLGRES